MAEELGALSFASLIRRGLAAGLQTPDAGAGGGPETRLKVEVDFGSGLAASADVPLIGPGDIVGLDSSVIVRTSPHPDDNDAEFDHFVLIEFDQADLLWRYSPAKEDAQGRLRPWINLVVLEEGEASLQAPSGTQKLPIVTTDVANLPDLSQSWAFAHTQLEGAGLSDGDIRSRIEGQPGLFVARLMSPRLLKAGTRYVACLVPTFMRGRIIGTGGTADDLSGVGSLTPAWDATSPSPVALPVYFSWRFQTGSVASFEELARLIQPRIVPKDVGRRDMDVQDPGLELPEAAASPLQVEGALQSILAFREGRREWPETERETWTDALKEFLNTPEIDGLRVVAPPLYAQWYAAESELDEPRPAGTNPPWFSELNADPRSRVGGALGTTVIQNEAEALLASGWKQVGDIESINYQLKVLQLAREMLLALFSKNVTSGSTQDFLTLTSRLHSRVQCETATVCSEFDASLLGPDLFDPAWRKWARPFGWLGRRQGRPLLPASFVPDLVARLSEGQHPAPEPSTPIGLFTGRTLFASLVPANVPGPLLIEVLGRGPRPLLFWGYVLAWVARKLLVTQGGQCYFHAISLLRFALLLLRAGASDLDVRARIGAREGSGGACEAHLAPANPFFAAARAIPATIPFPAILAGGNDSVDAAAFRLMLGALCPILDTPPDIPQQPPANPERCKGALEVALHPSVTVVESISRRIKLIGVLWQPKDPLEPMFVPPEYEQPMYVPLAEVSKDWILPGLEKIGRDTAGLGITNQRFIEAYMAGLNHEMTRELLWNEYPTDQRGTYFRQFWDIAGLVQSGVSPIPPEQLRDIKVLDSWSKDAPLGGNSPRPTVPQNAGPPTQGGEYLVLMLRAQLVQRYPNVIVYATKAPPPADPPALTDDEVHPVIFAQLRPDVGFYGFQLTPEQVRGNGTAQSPGYYFVLQEQPGEPKFGIQPETLARVGKSADGKFAVPLEAGLTSGDVADITFQDPFRVGIHGSTMVPEN